MTALVVGLGSSDRGDDGIGPVVAGVVASRGLDDVDVVPQVQPSELLHVMHGYDLVVVVDAMHSGGRPGSVAVLEPRASLSHTGASGTHDLGLAEVVQLARVLGRLPERLVVVAIECADLSHGAALSTDVEQAVPAAVDAVTAALT